MPIRTHQEQRSLAGADLDVGPEERELGAMETAGAIPAVQSSADAHGAGRSASELAYETPAAGGAKNEEELKRKAGALVKKDNGADYKRAVDHNDGDRGGAGKAARVSPTVRAA